jgi:FixJ family two-component response regulator
VSDTQQIIVKGIAGFIQKPFQSRELARAISDALTVR